MKRLFVITLLLPTILLAQHTIKGVFSPAEEYNFALLYKVNPTISDYVTNAEIQEDGSFEFKLDSTNTKGMYRLVYAVPQEDYNFDIIYNGKEDIELAFNSETGVAFQKSTENKLITSYTNSMSMVTQSIGNYFSQESKDTIALKAIFKTQRETQANFEKAAKNTRALAFIKANKPYIPKHIEGVNKYINNLRNHYFDHVDFNNQTLQSSNFLEERMLNYVFGMSSETKDEQSSYIENINVVYGHMQSAPKEVKRILLFDLWQQMSDLGHESVANYIAETYLMDIAVALNDQELLQSLILYQNLSKGTVAPDFEVEIKEKDKLVTKKMSALKGAENYVIVFWSSTCPHCLDEVPQLQTFVKLLGEDKVQVVAIGLEDEPYGWKNLTYDYPNFIHVYGEGKWDNEIGNAYGVSSTPAYFILDKDKKIVSKPINFDVLKQYFKTEEE
ncbi:MAG: TlpA disulfide reductase family protein [Algibacter sp.]|uniref:TlpA family protein disulfide reductase n=1 Tax=Algibacter sp. TaxID=1872428 RepID=UPI002609B86B|nr:TlpA disulfide reductase family protein [Algibacter sp.]MDG1728942.1 TlpA disulfide reductase family protein [Algibacter sp.]MDG2177180.1 TlpA disulfide reductase family protein [Algibacter sp.]